MCAALVHRDLHVHRRPQQVLEVCRAPALKVAQLVAAVRLRQQRQPHVARRAHLHGSMRV